MIQYCTGIPGSGKSYYGIFNIAIHFAKDLKDNKKFKSFALSETKYKSCLTNINELKFDKFENVKELDFNKFKIILTKLHNLYKLGQTDSELEEAVKDEDFFYTLIVLDECHNFLNKDDEVLIWWLSYHRHFFQDIILITQDLPLVNKKYKSFTEFYYKSIPSSRKILNISMIYHQYSGSQMFKTQKVNVKRLPIIKDIFSLYGSGENNKQKSIVVYFLIIAFALFILLFIVGYFFISSKTPEPKKEEPKTNINQTQSIQQPINKNTKKLNNQNKQPIMHNTKIEEDTTNLKLYKFNCFKDFCYYKQDKQITIEIPMPFLIAISKDMDKSNKYMLFEKNRTVIYLLANEEKFNFIKGVQNENKEDGNSLMPTVGIPN